MNNNDLVYISFLGKYTVDEEFITEGFYITPDEAHRLFSDLHTAIIENTVRASIKEEKQ